jgi:AcrR family transcriptional regulator
MGESMARPKTGTHDIPTETRILIAAERSFGELGFERSTLADIAKEAGIRRPSLLYHFKTKDDLYEQVVHRVFDALRNALGQAMVAGAFSQQIVALAQSFIEFTEAQPAFAPIVLREIIDGRGPARDILLKELAPLLGLVEKWIQLQGSQELPENISVRSAVLQFCSNVLLRNASGPLQEPLWGATNDSMSLVRQLFLKQPD